MLSSVCVQQRVCTEHLREVLQSSLAVSPSFSRGTAASTGHLALLIGPSPDFSLTGHKAQPDGPWTLYAWPGEASPLPHSGLPSSVFILVWPTVYCCSWAPWLTFSAPSLRLERPGSVPAGGLGCSPELLPSPPGLWLQPGQGPGGVLSQPLSDSLRSPSGKPQYVGQYSTATDCPQTPLGNVSWSLNIFGVAFLPDPLAFFHQVPGVRGRVNSWRSMPGSQPASQRWLLSLQTPIHRIL